MIRISYIGLVLMLVAGCKKESATLVEETYATPNLPSTPFNYAEPNLPNYLSTQQFINIDNTPAENPITDHGATLGRVLFYDTQLSRNKTISCASCHKQEHAFSDPNALSLGWQGGQTARHSMGLINSRYYQNRRFFWDERAATLEEQVLMPIEDQIEMGMTLDEVRHRLARLPYYAPLFKNAFGTAEINNERIAYALAQFVRSIVSVNSKYDDGRAQVSNDYLAFPNFTEVENQGKLLFSESGFSCSACHGSEAFISSFATSNGLDENPTDLGVGGITNMGAEMGTFKAPSLKNIMLRAPYMHDGRFSSIDQVLDHYSTGIKNHSNLDKQLTDFNTGLAKPMNFTQQDRIALKAFLNTLTDSVILHQEKFSNPF